MKIRERFIQQCQKGRIVVKVGSGLLTTEAGTLDTRAVRRIADDIASLFGKRRWPFIVSSGAIAAGIGVLGMKSRPKKMPSLQAAAAVGQSKLVEAWSLAFARYSVPVAQVLLTHADLSNRTRFLNARHALLELEARGAVCVINENDSVSTDEIAFGDNDQLASEVSNLVDASALVLLSVAAGLFDHAKNVVSEARAADPSLVALVRTDARSRTGVGGMDSKLLAARRASERGAYVAIAGGDRVRPISDLLSGRDVGTILAPEESKTPLKSRAYWILHTLRPKGRVVVDDGARRAIVDGKKSILPSGIVEVVGTFAQGDPVDVTTARDTEPIARGLVSYDSASLTKLIGVPSRAIQERLGFSNGDAAIHRDDLVLLA